MSTEISADPLLQVLGYHQTTKHHFFRYARALGYLDWANQPDPFRRFDGAPLIRLPLISPDDEPQSPSYDRIFHPESIPSQPVTIRSLSRFFEYALAISAWKQAGETRWALRVNPSSGNLHPTEGYLLLGPLEGFLPVPGLYHYAPKEHGLELRTECSVEAVARLLNPFPPGSFLFGVTSIHWREAWKYGERAFRYGQHDAGHAIGAARIAAATLGWRFLLLDGTSDDSLQILFGLDRRSDFQSAELEHPDCVAVIWPERLSHGTIPLALDAEEVPRLATRWHGHANRLSRDQPVPWDIIDIVTQASWKSETENKAIEWLSPAQTDHRDIRLDSPRAGDMIRQRRSAVAFDGKTTIPAASFFAMLLRVMPHSERKVHDRPVPWDGLPWEPHVHLGLFVHRVEGLLSGLYALVRDPRTYERFRRAMHGSFAWEKPDSCPNELPLFLLQAGDARRLAAQVSCHQDIAGDGAFSLGMIADFEPALREAGPWVYRRLFWETGVIGQVLYLEAEAAGVRATGMGCYFDDPVHQVFGLTDTTFQSLYHFAVGGPLEDHRLTTLPAYREW